MGTCGFEIEVEGGEEGVAEGGVGYYFDDGFAGPE
jgi:hypothetical protein